MIASDTIQVETSFRFETISPSEEVYNLVYVLHGYGQLVRYFKEKFIGTQKPHTLFVFPEGKHRFYLNGVSGRVGASWMTKEWREDDIQFNINALNSLHKQLTTKYSSIKTITVLGFSQGGATAARWIASAGFSCNHFISWASVFPPDVTIVSFEHIAEKTTFVVGKNDEYFPEKTRVEHCDWYKKLGAEIITFDGKHDIHIETLNQLL